jgi:hypothetical protein
MEQHRRRIPLPEWITRYGGQELLDREGLEVLPCGEECDDRICHGWRVRLKQHDQYWEGRTAHANRAAFPPVNPYPPGDQREAWERGFRRGADLETDVRALFPR